MWPFDQIDLVLSSGWLLGSIIAAASSLLYSLGLILQKKACYQIMGSRIASDDPVPKWSALLKRKLFWVGLVLFILKDPLYTISLQYTSGIDALPIGAGVVLFANVLFSYAVLYEDFKYSDVAAMVACVTCSVIMSIIFANSVPEHKGGVPYSHIRALQSNPWANEAFCIYGGICWVMGIACLLVCKLTDVVTPFALTCLASLLWATFRLLSSIALTLIEMEVSYLRSDKANDIIAKQDRQLYYTVAVWTVIVFILSVFATCEGVRQLPCRYFLFGSVIGTDVLARIQVLLFYRDWVFMPALPFYTFIGAAIMSVICVCIVSARSGVTLPSPGRQSLIENQVMMHSTITHIMDEYKMRIPEAQHPLDLKLIDMQPDKFGGMRQQFPLIFFLLIVGTPAVCWFTGYVFSCFTLCTIFSVLQGWKMGAFIPLFSYVGIRKMERFSHADFRALYETEEAQADGEHAPTRPKWDDVVHFVIIPNFKESLDDLRMTIDSVAASDIAKDQIGIVLAMEKGEEGSMSKARTLIDEYNGKFKYAVATCHPMVLKNGEHPVRECAGKSANAQWAARRLFAAIKGESKPPQPPGKYSAFGCLCCSPGSAAAPRDLQALDEDGKERRRKKEEEIAQEAKDQDTDLANSLGSSWFNGTPGINLDNVVLTVGDADSEFHPKYFEALTYYYIQAGGDENETPLRYLCMWQPPILHMKNFLNQPWPVRFASIATSSHELANLADPNATRVAYSTYSLSAKLADGMDGWDPEWMTEDWHTTLKVFLTTSGRLRVMPIFLPILNNTPEGNTVRQSLMARWEQAKRHAYGISEIVFFHEHMLRVFNTTPGIGNKFVFAWRTFFMWFKLMWIHVFVAVFPVFAPLNGWLITYFNGNRSANETSINSWCFLVNCVFQIVGLVSVIFTLVISIALFESVKHRVDGVYQGKEYAPNLALRWKNPVVNVFVFTAQSVICLPFTCVAFASVEWRAAWKTAMTKGGGFVYISAAMGASNAKSGSKCAIL